mgnify:CR=1 FL=1
MFSVTSCLGDVLSEAEGYADVFAQGRVDGTRDLFADADLPAPSIVWRPHFADLHHPVLKGFHRGLGAANGTLPTAEWVDGEDFAALDEWCVVLEPVEDGRDYRYLHYGRKLCENAGNDLTGGRVSDIAARAPQISVFLLAVYHSVLRRREPVKTLHAAPQAAFSRQWRRFIVPLARPGTDRHVLIGAAAADNELRAGLEFLPDPVLVVDCAAQVQYANRAARREFEADTAFCPSQSFAEFTGLDIALPARPEDVIAAKRQTTIRARRVSRSVIRPFEVTVGASYFRDRAFFVILARPRDTP